MNGVAEQDNSSILTQIYIELVGSILKELKIIPCADRSNAGSSKKPGK